MIEYDIGRSKLSQKVKERTSRAMTDLVKYEWFWFIKTSFFQFFGLFVSPGSRMKGERHILTTGVSGLIIYYYGHKEPRKNKNVDNMTIFLD